MGLSVREIVIKIYVKSYYEAIFMHIYVVILLRLILDAILFQGQIHIKIDEPATFDNLEMVEARVCKIFSGWKMELNCDRSM